MHKIAKTLFFCMIFVVNIVNGQKYRVNYPTKTAAYWSDSIFKKSLKFNNSNAFIKPYPAGLLQSQIYRAAYFYKDFTHCRIITADFYTRNFGFFCKKELEFEKKSKIPLRFRLGSLQYNDYLEGKPNSGVLPKY